MAEEFVENHLEERFANDIKKHRNIYTMDRAIKSKLPLYRNGGEDVDSIDDNNKNAIINKDDNGAYLENSDDLSQDSKNLDGKLFNNSESKSVKSLKKRECQSPTCDKKKSKKFCCVGSKGFLNGEGSCTSKSSSCSSADTTELKQENIIPNTDLNDVYMGILSESIKSFPKSEITRRRLKCLKRRDLENLILQHMVTIVMGDCKLGYQKDLCTRLENHLEYSQKIIAQLNREIKDLKKITQKVTDEHAKRSVDLIYPVVIKRSVAIQAEPYYNDPYSEEELSSEEVAVFPPKPTGKRKKDDEVHTKLKVQSEQDEDNENMSDMDDRNGYESLVDESDPDEREEIYKRKLSRYNNMFKNGTKIPRPTLSAKQKKSSIVLTWNTPLSTCQDIASFRLFSCQNDKLKSKKRWKVVGDVEPMELPMACTLTDFHPDRTYHFAVKAINFKGESGQMSKSEAVRMS